MLKYYDVVVIGAGLAGLQCAQLLSAQGNQVLLVDRKPSLTTTIHTTGIFVRRTLEDFVVPEECLGPVIRQVKLYSPRHHIQLLESNHDEFRIAQMGKLYLHYLEACSRAGVAWIPATHYRGWEAIDKTTLCVTLETDRKPWSVQTRYLVGADGAVSHVARDLGLDLNTTWITGVEDVFHQLPLEGPPCFHCFLDAELAPGYLAWVVNDGEEVHLGVGGYAARFDPLQALERFRARLSTLVNLDTAIAVERRSGRIPVGGVLNHIANKYGLLVGDAAGAVSPLTAGGLDPCLRLSSFAARVITNYLATENPQALLAYNGNAFRTHFRSRLWMRTLLAGMPNQAVIEAACAILRLPFLRSVAQHIFFGRGSFPDLSEARPLTRDKFIDIAPERQGDVPEAKA